MKGIFGWFFKQVLGSFAGWLGGLLKDWWAARKLQKQTARADRAEDAVRQQAQVITNAKVRRDVDRQVQALPEAPPQRVADANPDTAAGKLREHGWTRD